MSMIQRTTQLKNKPKVSTSTKTANGLSRTSSQIKPSTSKSKAVDEKDKIKTNISKTQSLIASKAVAESIKTNTVSTVKANAGSTVKTNTGATAKVNVVSTIHKANARSMAGKTVLPIKKRLPPARNATTTTTEKPTDKTQPVRAKHNAAILEAVKKNTGSVNSSSKKAAQIKPNAVLDTFHNVTVASPPPVRKKEAKMVEKRETAQQPDTLERPVRTGTGTLEPEEIIVLRSESAKRRSERQILDDEAELPKMVSTLKEPVAFEVNFEQPATRSASKNRDRSKSRNTNEEKRVAVATEDDQSNYSDDFESYESDFETSSGTSQNGSTAETETEESNVDSDDGSKSANEKNISSSSNAERAASVNVENIKDADESEEESELTQYPVTVIQRDKERERKLDSGHYEMNSRIQAKLSELSILSSQQQFDSLDTFSATTSDQLDSGISSYGNAMTQAADLVKVKSEVFYGGYVSFNTRPILSKRGKELMSKIQFDTLTFSLFEMKPISYDIYMQSYGKLNTTQSSTQTHENRMSADCQTDDCDVRSMWTQHPPQYDLQTVQKLENGLVGLSTVHNCCGEFAQTDTYATDAKPADEYEASLLALNAFRQNKSSRTLNQHMKRTHKPIDFERLSTFLLTSSMLMSNVLNSAAKNSNNVQKHDSLQSTELAAISAGYFNLGTRFLNALHVVRIFASSKYNLVVTVHESLPDADVYRSDFSNLLMVWSTREISKPIRLLSTWSEVCRAEICNDCSDIIVCGLRDGSIAMWDLRETYSFCSKLDGYLTHFAATQSIVPTWGQQMGDKTNMVLTDMGAVVDVKSFRTPPKTLGLSNAVTGYKSIQFTSLNDTGILAVWTLVEIAARQYDIPTKRNTSHKSRNSPQNHNSKFEYSSPWARVKLIQSAICDLRDYLNRGIIKAQSQFDKTKSHFQKNIYSDEVLRKLNDTHSDMRKSQNQGIQGLRFTSIDTGCERIYVCTNRNFILACSKTLKVERFRKIAINESRFLFPTALRVLTNEDFLAVGLSNGSVMIVNCNQYKALRYSKDGQNNSLMDSTTQHAIKLPDTPDIVLETGKSCVIQNIILNERRSFDSDSNYMKNYPAADDTRPTTAAFIEMITNQKRPFELRVYDQQLLLSGSVLRKDLVQSLELSSDGWRLFALSNCEVRTYDFYLDREVEYHVRESDKKKIVDIAVARTAHNEQHLLILNTDNDVQVHVIKQ